MRASVGIAMFPEHGRDVETLMQRADIAMYSAKARGVGAEVYSASRDGHSRARLALIGELPDAIQSGQVVVHYQPKFNLETGEVAGAEALVRWDHPQFGLLGPGAFLPLAEQTGLMRPLTLRVLDDALAQCAAWRDEGLNLPVAVNLGAPNLLDLGLPADVHELLAKWDVDPGMLQLEITETIVAADPVRVIEIMNRLGELGISLSLDDFGTGSSSLAYLRELPVQELKIDKSFILGMDEDREAATIVETIVDLAHNLGLRAVGEGIETEEAYRLLAASGCDFGQGFLMGRPMPAAELTALAAREPVSRLAARLDDHEEHGEHDQEARQGADPAFALRLALIVLRERRRPVGELLLGHRRELLVRRDEVRALQAAEDDRDRERDAEPRLAHRVRVHALVDAGDDQQQQRRRGELARDLHAQVVHERQVLRVQPQREREADRQREGRAEADHGACDVQPERDVVEAEVGEHDRGP